MMQCRSNPQNKIYLGELRLYLQGFYRRLLSDASHRINISSDLLIYIELGMYVDSITVLHTIVGTMNVYKISEG